MKVLKNLSLDGCCLRWHLQAVVARVPNLPISTNSFSSRICLDSRLKEQTADRACWFRHESVAGRDSVTTRLFISVTGNPFPRVFRRAGPRRDAQRIRECPRPISHARRHRRDGTCGVGVSGLDYISNPTFRARRDSIGDVEHEGNITLNFCFARP